MISSTLPQSENRLATINERLSSLLAIEPIRLTSGACRSLEDRLWVWGIVGGKDVGKSTLINALAGAAVVDSEAQVGEGTRRPQAYCCDADVSALRARMDSIEGVEVALHSTAPVSMRGLVLVDLPDFDSLFSDHIEHVRRTASMLDGVVWVTTPKKVGDRRGIDEIRRVLKSRTNFLHVVNKMDWLLGQSPDGASRELDQVQAALELQSNESSTLDGKLTVPSFLISARYQSAERITSELARSRDGGGGGGASTMVLDAPDFTAAIARIARDFTGLRTALTTAPTAESAEFNKRANLSFQVRRQAAELIEYYQPGRIIETLERAVGREGVEQAIQHSFPAEYCARVMLALTTDRSLGWQWSGTLFRRRIVHWPLLGVIAWPLAAIGGLLSALVGVSRSLPWWTDQPSDQLFQMDGISLTDRADALLKIIQSGLVRMPRRIAFELPSMRALAQQFQMNALELAQVRRSAAIEPYLQPKPGTIGRTARGLLTLGVLLWFPFVQPILASVLEIAVWHEGWPLEAARLIVRALSATNVLAGLAVSALILAGLVGAVYARAVRDGFAAHDSLRNMMSDWDTAAPTHGLIEMIRRPVEAVQNELQEITTALERLSRSGILEPS